MKAIKNIDKHDLEVSFDFNTYSFIMDKAVFIPDDLYLHLQETMPMSFDFKYKAMAKTPVPQVRKTKTRIFIPSQEQAANLGNEDMRIQSVHPKPTFGNPDELPNGVDKDGVSWYGEGVQVEGAN